MGEVESPPNLWVLGHSL